VVVTSAGGLELFDVGTPGFDDDEHALNTNRKTTIARGPHLLIGGA
jgi:hypothetical protein